MYVDQDVQRDKGKQENALLTKKDIKFAVEFAKVCVERVSVFQKTV